MRRRGLLVACLMAACGVRAPAPVDVAKLVDRHGPTEARRALAVRIVDDPKDIAARLALASLAEEQGRPSEAIEQLEVVLALGGPIGTRWRDADRARLARLLAHRGRARTVRGAPTGLADLERARELGASIDAADLVRARLARAIGHLRHVDAGERARGKQLVRALVAAPGAMPAWRGALANARPAERGELGRWLWSVGARRAAWEELAAWHAATRPPRGGPLQDAYLIARSWWAPVDASPPPAADLVGPERCRFAGAGCKVAELDVPGIDAMLVARPSPTSDPDEALAWLSITLGEALRGNAAWGPSFASRVDVAAIPTEQLPVGTRAAFARLAGREAREDTGGASTAAARLLAAAGIALRGGSVVEVRTALGPAAETDEAATLLRLVTPPPADPDASFPRAVAAHVRARVPEGPAAPALARVLAGYARDPVIADRLAGDVVAEAVDAAPAHAALGTLFEVVGDPARARSAWEAAVAASAEPAYVQGLAESLARANDPDAALVIGTAAAAASGDPAVVWLAVARALEANGEHVHALEAARSAIDLAGLELTAPALDVAISASVALGRVSQAEGLRARRAAVSPPLPERDGDPTDPAAALASYHAGATADSIARLWVASRWNARDVSVRAALRQALAADDPRRATISGELVALAADRDPERGRAALRALR